MDYFIFWSGLEDLLSLLGGLFSITVEAVRSIQCRSKIGLALLRVIGATQSKTKNSLITLKELLRGDTSSPRLLNLVPVFGSLRKFEQTESDTTDSQPLRNRRGESCSMLEPML